MSAKDLLRKKESVYKDLKLAEKDYSDDQIIDLMRIYPDLIERPIIEMGERAIIARPAEKLKEFFEPVVQPEAMNP